jgi:pescadillo protein
LRKDIQFLSHEPLLAKFRELKAFYKRLKKYAGKREWSKVNSLNKNIKPKYTLDHLVRERYPSFVDALRDLDDPLSMLALFATLPRTGEAHTIETSATCARLLHEFEGYIIATGGLRKSFISIKGIYYEAEVMGQTVTWVVPHEFTTPVPTDVDFEVMLTFLEFYLTLMRFVNYRLFTRLGWEYPQKFISEGGEDVVIASQLPPVSQPEEIFPNGDERMLHSSKIFISREVPRKAVAFVLQCLGAEISIPTSEDDIKLLSEDDPTLTHQIVDRPALLRMFVDRHYIQPQWVFDSLNAGKLVDMDLYRIGATLPPHMSPFVTEEDEETMMATDSEAEDETPEIVAKKAQRELAVSMLSKKRQKLYGKMQHSRQQKLQDKKILQEKKQKAQTQQ